MSLAAACVGRRARPWSGVLDARWLMAYAAGLGRDEDAYFDTARHRGITAHPVFPIAAEWALLTAPESGLDGGLSDAEAMRGVHASHDLHLHRPIRQDEPVTVRAEIAGAQRSRSGARMTVRFDGIADDGEAIWTSWMGNVYRGVDLDGEDRPPAVALPVPEPAAGQADSQRAVEIGLASPHVYSECARIWNPIHTDRSVARAVGLQTPILHGSASFAHGVDWALECLGAAPSAVTRLGASFAAMVPVPSTITVAARTDGRDTAWFEVRTAAGELAVRNGFIVATSGGH